MYNCNKCGWGGYGLKENPDDMTMRCPKCNSVFMGCRIPVRDRFRPINDNICDACAERESHTDKEFPCSHCENNGNHVEVF